jgi:hypothetical protein
MFPNNDDMLYLYARMRSHEIRSEVESARAEQKHAESLRRRFALALGVGLIGLTLVATLLVLGWWIL